MRRGKRREICAAMHMEEAREGGEGGRTTTMEGAREGGKDFFTEDGAVAVVEGVSSDDDRKPLDCGAHMGTNPGAPVVLK